MQRPSNAGLRLGAFRRLLIGGMAGALLLAGAGQAGAQTTASCVKLSDVEMVQLLNRWRAEFTNGGAERLSGLYADDATLIATKDGASFKGRDAILRYYRDLLSRHPKLSIRPSTLASDCGTATISGPVVYRVTGERKGTRMLLGGHYTAVFGLRGGAWQIIRHSLAADQRSIGDGFDAAADKP